MTTTATELIDILIEDNGLNEYRLADKVGTNVHWIKEWRKKGFSSFQSAKRFLNAFGYELSKNWEITRDGYFSGDAHALWIPEKTVLVTDW